MKHKSIRCDFISGSSRMFTVGREYAALPTDNSDFNPNCFQVIDDLGHARFMLWDSLRFVVGDNNSGSPLFATFVPVTTYRKDDRRITFTEGFGPSGWSCYRDGEAVQFFKHESQAQRWLETGTQS